MNRMNGLSVRVPGLKTRDTNPKAENRFVSLSREEFMYGVIREIHFHYGHRLLNYEGRCKHLHGHSARVQIEISSRKLNRRGMVADFYDIKETIGKWVHETLDHQMILCAKDPLIAQLRKAGEPIVVIPENPTAEVLARWIYQEARKRGLPVSKVTLWESDSNCAYYSEA